MSQIGHCLFTFVNKTVSNLGTPNFTAVYGISESIIIISLYQGRRNVGGGGGGGVLVQKIAAIYCLYRDLKCEFKGHAIIARARGGSLGTRLLL